MSKKKLNTEQIEEMALALIAAEEAAKIAKKKEQDDLLEKLASTVEGKLTTRMGFRKAKESQWLSSMKLYLGNLASWNTTWQGQPSPGVGTRPEHNIVHNKCEIAIAQTMTYQFAAGDKNWSLGPPQTIELDPIEQKAMEGMPPGSRPEDLIAFKASLMEREIDYHLTCSKYGPECREVAEDRVVLGAGVMKLPSAIGRMKKVYVPATNPETGKVERIPKFTQEIVPSVYRVNPWYFFPDDSVNDINEAEDTIEIHPMSRTAVRDLVKHPGFMADKVLEVLAEEGPKTYVNSPFNDAANLTQGLNTLKGKYMMIEYHGPITKDDLGILDRAPTVEDPLDEYYCEIWVVNGKVVRFELENIEGGYRLPYCVSVWKADPASVFGFGLPMLANDQQKVVNETYKMMIDNAGVSSGPQIVIDTTLIKPAEGGLVCEPWKVWYADDNFAQSDMSKAIQFFVPTNAYEGLSQLFLLAKSLADEECSIPALMSGIQNPTGAVGATQTAIYNENAQSPMFFKAEEWDDDITRPVIEAMYDWEMRFNPKDEIKGTYDIDVRTSTSVLRGSIEQQKLQLLRQEIAQGSPIGEWVKMDGLALASLSGMHLPNKGLIKSPEEVAQERANAPEPPPDPNLLKAQAAMITAQNETKRLELDSQQMQFDMGLKHQEVQMKYQAQLRTDETRDKESQAQVLKAMLDYQTALAQLAARDQENRAKIYADLQKTDAEIQAQKFLKGMEIPLKMQDQEIKREELEIKKKQGEGITSVR